MRPIGWLWLALAAPLAAQHPSGAPPSPPAAPGPAALRRAHRDESRYDGTFRKYSKRYFGAAFDWRFFKAQGLAESGLDATARSRVGARGVMQLMPSTFRDIQSKRPEFSSIDDPEWNIAAGIMHDRYLWKLWLTQIPDGDRPSFMFASYNAGEGTIARATNVARASALDGVRWSSIEQVAPNVPRWRYRETLGYVRTIAQDYQRLSATR
ncbi:MAG: transglycosylase SLT domain-containing protein [Gemmatimonadetes bacterium]|nr:transglycosylase SLT domain-containing protein [Gemmatimonadota bacterium]